MLSNLHIENVAVIENAEMELSEGLNILTGETGAGKSILIDSINLVLGERVSKDIVRTGCQKAHVSALFSDLSETAIKMLTDLGFECDEDDNLLIQRDISADGKGSCRIAGRPATVSMLRDIGRILVNIHGQHDNQTLLSAEKHIIYLDRYAQTQTLLSDYADAYAQMRATEKQLKNLQTDDAMKARRIDLLSYQIEEIELAGLKLGEDEELQSQKLIIANSEKISAALSSAYTSLSGGNGSDEGRKAYEAVGAAELVTAAGEALGVAAEFYPEVKPLYERLTGLSYELEDCAEELRSYTGTIEYNPDELELIEQRLDTIYKLKRKYGATIEEILQYLASSKQELDTIESADIVIEKLQRQLEESKQTVQKLALKLTEARKKSAETMEKLVKGELEYLEMPGVTFMVQIKPQSPTSNGMDKVEFLISANPGSPAKPIAKIASGGEISRIMLGIKNVLAGNDDIDTLIFDEVDTGVSGRAAQKIGMKLKQVSKGRQVICVTHLAQIAAQADSHILIEKNISAGNTYTTLRKLNFVGRKEELARIIGGVNITELTTQNAEEMLRLAGNLDRQ